MRPLHALLLSLLFASPTLAQFSAPPKAIENRAADKDEPPAVSHHEMSVGGKAMKYTVTAGLTPIKNEKGEVEARVFSVAYTLDEAKDKAKRPLMFSFNGGPGSSSVWLHLGALGPKRVVMPDDAEFARPPFNLADNESTWLDKTDLVFIDPVGTGWSRAAKPELNAKFHGLKGDIDSVGEFIRLYLAREGRWMSPLYLVGESYGTTRAAGLSDWLVEKGIALNGIVLVSSVLSFQTVQFAPGNDLPYVLYLPTYAASAWYHKKLAGDLQKDLAATIKEVSAWAIGDYAKALEKGDGLSAEDRGAMLDKLARYTGLDRDYLDRADGRIEIQRFCKELLRKEKRTVGRLDSRFKGIDASHVNDTPENDPSMSAIRPPYTSAFNAYARDDLGYRTDVPYHILGEGVGRWDWGNAGRNGFPSTAEPLRDAMAKNPSLKVLVASGYYDLATPFFATEYTFAHMNLDPSQRPSVRFTYYESGHMMYLHGPSLRKLKADVGGFLDESK